MIENKVNFLYKKIMEEYKLDNGLQYPTDKNNGFNYEYLVEKSHFIINNKVSIEKLIHIFQDFSSWYLDNSQYEVLYKNDAEQSMEYFEKSTIYAYLVLLIRDSREQCVFLKDIEYPILDNTTSLMAQLLLCGWVEEYEKVGVFLIDSLEYRRKKEEYSEYNFHLSSKIYKSITGFFLLKLYAKVFDIKSSDSNKTMFYEEILEKWDTNDLSEIDRLTYNMSDYHIEETKQNNKEIEYHAFSLSKFHLFPYEILVWLKLREYKGLMNPREFTHPLMNTRISKIFLNIKEPLSKDIKLPYIKKILERLKKECPNINL